MHDECWRQRAKEIYDILNRGGSPRGERPCRVGLRRRLADDGKRLDSSGPKLDVASRVPEAAELNDLSYSKRGGSPRGERIMQDRTPDEAGGFLFRPSQVRCSRVFIDIFIEITQS